MRRVALLLALIGWGLASRSYAGPVLSTGPYTVTLPDGASFEVSGTAAPGGVGYIYTYTVKSLNVGQTHTFELGIAENYNSWGKYTESNPQVSAGPGELYRDLLPHTSDFPWLGKHNYVFAHFEGKKRLGIPIAGGETQILSFEDPHDPILERWSLREMSPHIMTRNNFFFKVGLLPAPHGAPEPSTLVLAAIGIGGLGLRAWRKRRSPSA